MRRRTGLLALVRVLQVKILLYLILLSHCGEGVTL